MAKLRDLITGAARGGAFGAIGKVGARMFGGDEMQPPGGAAGAAEMLPSAVGGIASLVNMFRKRKKRMAGQPMTETGAIPAGAGEAAGRAMGAIGNVFGKMGGDRIDTPYSELRPPTDEAQEPGVSMNSGLMAAKGGPFTRRPYRRPFMRGLIR